jgi:hypothetical protein
MSFSVLEMDTLEYKDRYSEYKEQEKRQKKRHDWSVSFDERITKSCLVSYGANNSKSDWKDIISTYFGIDHKLNLIKSRRDSIKERFKAYTWVHSPMAVDESGMSWVRYPNFNSVVDHYVDAVAATEEVLKAMETKKEQFSKFLATLDSQQIYLLKNGLDDHLIKLAVESIKNIESKMPLQYRF